jgi:hypothetical protein
VILAKWGATRPDVYSVNRLNQKIFKKGQNLYPDDWVKLDSFKDSKVSSVSLSGSSMEGVSMVQVYVQKLQND